MTSKVAQAREASAICSLENLHFLKSVVSPVSSSIQKLITFEKFGDEKMLPL